MKNMKYQMNTVWNDGTCKTEFSDSLNQIKGAFIIRISDPDCFLCTVYKLTDTEAVRFMEYNGEDAE